jgi:hypothetical protein
MCRAGRAVFILSLLVSGSPYGPRQAVLDTLPRLPYQQSSVCGADVNSGCARAACLTGVRVAIMPLVATALGGACARAQLSRLDVGPSCLTRSQGQPRFAAPRECCHSQSNRMGACKSLDTVCVPIAAPPPPAPSASPTSAPATRFSVCRAATACTSRVACSGWRPTARSAPCAPRPCAELRVTRRCAV